MNTVELLGVERVQSAANRMVQAAELMAQAANTITDTAERHQRWAEDYLARQQAFAKELSVETKGYAPIDDLPVEGMPMLNRPEPIAYIKVEGDSWADWETRPTHSSRFHTIKFSDGSIFDMVNGWRK